MDKSSTLKALFEQLGEVDYNYLKLHGQLEVLEMDRTRIINEIMKLEEGHDKNLDDGLGLSPDQ